MSERMNGNRELHDDVKAKVMEHQGVTDEDVRIAQVTRQYHLDQKQAVADKLEQAAKSAYDWRLEESKKRWDWYYSTSRIGIAMPAVPHPSNIPPYVSPKDMPGASYRNTLDRDSWRRVQNASEDPESEVDIQVLKRVTEMEDHVAKVKRAMRVVETEAEYVPRHLGVEDRNDWPAERGYVDYQSDAKLERIQRGNNSVGMEQAWGAMARSAIRMYDIKDGVAMRARLRNGNQFSRNNNINLAATDHIGAYEPFAPQYQERAKELMRSLAKKQHEKGNEKARRHNIKAAKEVIGRAGVQIPKVEK